MFHARATPDAGEGAALGAVTAQTYAGLAEASGLPLETVVQAAADNRLADVVQRLNRHTAGASLDGHGSTPSAPVNARDARDYLLRRKDGPQ